jgi:protein TonB
MKMSRTNPAQMDEIVFEKRNKAYGAYFLRKIYIRHLIRALLLSVSILIAGLVYPVVSGYYAKFGKQIRNDDGTVFMPIPEPPAEAPPDLPEPPPPPNSEILKQIAFVAPEVVEGEVIDDDNFFNQEELFNSSSNNPVDINLEEPIVKKTEVIEIKEDEPPVIFVEEMPSFPGGDEERQRFLYDNIIYPPSAAETGIEGRVYVQFVVDTKGNITDVKVLRGIGGGCDEEALRIVKMMPPWHPGKQNSKTVRVLYNMSIIFRLKS